MEKFASWFWAILDLPALVLIVILSLLIYVLYKIQKDPENNFDFADMLRDETGKPSAGRMMVLICGAVSSWGLMYMLIHSDDSKIDPIFFLGYIAIWSGSAVASKWIDMNRMMAGAQFSVRADYRADLSSNNRRDGYHNREDYNDRNIGHNRSEESGADTRREDERQQALEQAERDRGGR